MPICSKQNKALIYTENYPSFGQDDREALRALVRKVVKPDCHILEIGSWLGAGSTRVIIEELALIGSGRLYCVDTWKGNLNVARHQEIVATHDVFATFIHNVTQAGGEPYVSPLVMSSRDAAAIVAERRFDLVFIDGDHSYDQTREDIALWRPKVVSGGILCGHDCECRVKSSLHETLLANRSEDYIAGVGTPFAAVHPGVVIAVEEAFDGEAHLWAEEPLLRSDGTIGRATLWDVVVP